MAGTALIGVDDTLLVLVGQLGDALRARGWRLATAESCTGGLLAGACTEPAGASDWFAAGVVSYANDAKSGLLGVPPAVIAAHGAVSGEVARAMALGALARADVQLAVAITGIAGPGGGSAAKPVGTVWLGVAWHSASGTQACRAERLQLDGDRAQIRGQTVAAALRRLIAVAHEGGWPDV